MRDRLTALAVWAAAGVVLAAFAWLVGDVLWRGLPGVSWAFLTQAPASAGRAGGIAPIVLATAWIVAIAIATALPLGVASAVWLVEYAGRQPARQQRIESVLDVLAGVPSIVFGLFGNAVFVVALGLGFSILSGGLTLACMALPVLVRVIAIGLQAVPDTLRQGAAACGLTRWTTLRRLLLPAAAPALLAGTLLGIGRALAETAALLFTSGYVDRYPGSPLDSGRAMSVHIYDLAMNVPGGERNAYASALVLVVLIVAINLATHAAIARWRRRMT